MRVGYNGILVNAFEKPSVDCFYEHLQLHIRNKNAIKFSGELREAETEFSRLLKILEDCFSFRNLFSLFQQLRYFCKVADDIQSHKFFGNIQSKEFTTNHNKFHWILKFSSDENILILKIYSKNRKIKITSNDFHDIMWLAYSVLTRFEDGLSKKITPCFDDYMMAKTIGRLNFTIEEEI